LVDHATTSELDNVVQFNLILEVAYVWIKAHECTQDVALSWQKMNSELPPAMQRCDIFYLTFIESDPLFMIYLHW
jgi:hypothetical protein